MKPSKKHPTPKQLEAILSLLADTDPDVVFSLAQNVKGMSEEELAAILEAWTKRVGPCMPPAFDLARRLAAMDNFCFLASRQTQPELEDGVFLISSWGRPDLPQARARLKLDAYAGHISDTVTRHHAREKPGETARTLCRYLFEEIGFGGNDNSYSDPDNSFLAAVLERRTGIPISLSVLALLIAKRIHLELLPIGSPGRFLLAVREQDQLTYIDCFGGGKFLKAPQARKLIGKLPAGFDPFPAVDTREILARMLRNLQSSYRQLEDQRRLIELDRMLSAVSI